MSNFWRKLDKPIIGLAPMAGITDSPFRRIAKDWGAELVYSEMISSHALVYRNKKAFELGRFRKMERPIIIQLFGREPSIMAEAARIVENEIKADGVDINFGCPAKRVVKSGHGAALMDEPQLAGKIVRVMVKAIKIPLSVKTRLGEKRKTEIYDFAKRMEEMGTKAIAIHGRTLKQGYKGSADWKPIYKVAAMVSIFVLGNGDIKNQKDIAGRLSQAKISGVLIGRGAFGNPFIFHGVRAIKKDPERFIKNEGFEFAAVSSNERRETILKQANYALETKGKRGLIELRKHLAAYVKGSKNAKEIRSRLVKTSTCDEIETVLKKYENYL
ncbi:MAG: tRNA-dihydrouridine synthase family protein [Candidatus Berkelbacteria bacterium]|nr:tRNA-dihydrouridine synthase family protein [Candidatus Berkelbacteria bacterium]